MPTDFVCTSEFWVKRKHPVNIYEDSDLSFEDLENAKLQSGDPDTKFKYSKIPQ